MEKIENLFKGYKYVYVRFEETLKEVNDLKRKYNEDMEEIKVLKNKVQLLEEQQKDTRIEEVNFLYPLFLFICNLTMCIAFTYFPRC